MRSTTVLGVETTTSADAPPDLFDRHRHRLSSLSGPIRDLLLILRGDIEVANRFAAEFREATVHVLDVRGRQPDDEDLSLAPRVVHVAAPTLQARIDYLAHIPRPQVILESGNRRRAHKLGNLRELFYFLPPGGQYLINKLQEYGDPRFDDRKDKNVLEAVALAVSVAAMSARAAREHPHHVRELAASLRTAHFEGHTAALHKGTRHYFKLRDRQADEILRDRYRSKWGETLVDQPAPRPLRLSG